MVCYQQKELVLFLSVYWDIKNPTGWCSWKSEGGGGNILLEKKLYELLFQGIVREYV